MQINKGAAWDIFDRQMPNMVTNKPEKRQLSINLFSLKEKDYSQPSNSKPKHTHTHTGKKKKKKKKLDSGK